MIKGFCLRELIICRPKYLPKEETYLEKIFKKPYLFINKARRNAYKIQNRNKITSSITNYMRVDAWYDRPPSCPLYRIINPI